MNIKPPLNLIHTAIPIRLNTCGNTYWRMLDLFLFTIAKSFHKDIDSKIIIHVKFDIIALHFDIITRLLSAFCSLICDTKGLTTCCQKTINRQLTNQS